MAPLHGARRQPRPPQPAAPARRGRRPGAAAGAPAATGHAGAVRPAGRRFKFRPAPAGAHRRQRRDPVAVGGPDVLRRADRLESSEGADWSEAGIGINAISEALVGGEQLHRPAGDQHLVRTHHE